MQLLTVTAEGWPHVALLSVGEVLAVSGRELRLALWPSSTTTANLERTGRATLAAVVDGQAVYVELGVSEPPRRTREGLARLHAEVRSVKVDAVDYARLESGIAFALPDPEPVVERWTATVAELAEPS